MTGHPSPAPWGGIRGRRTASAGRRRGPALLAALWLGAAPAAAEAPAGAMACAGCHPPAALAGPVPSLAGRAPETIVADMQAFRSGARSATVMDRIAKGFSDEETRAIAEWLAAERPAEP